MPPTSNAGDHGPPTSQNSSDNRQQPSNSNPNFDQLQQNSVEPLAASSPSTKKGSFFKKNVEDGMDRYRQLYVAITISLDFKEFLFILSLFFCIFKTFDRLIISLERHTHLPNVLYFRFVFFFIYFFYKFTEFWSK